MNSLLKLDKVSSYPLSDYCESLHLQAFHRGQKVLEEVWGTPYKYYDYSSLTKVIFTVSALLRAYECHSNLLTESIVEFLPWSNLKNKKVEQFLNHTSGFPWWRPFYSRIKYSGNWQKRRQQLLPYLQRLRSQSTKKAVYSDPNFLILGFLLENLYKQDLLEIWRGLQNDLGLDGMHFQENNRVLNDKKDYAPTYSHQWRPGWQRGVVNDANTRAMGGVSSHAGLFGGMDDLSKWSLLLRQTYYEGSTWCKKETMQKFTNRSILPAQGDWALGFMLPSKHKSSSGKFFGEQSIGHLGFTGTSFWFDPERDLIINILSNRYIPPKRGRDFKDLRPLLHNWVVGQIGGGS